MRCARQPLRYSECERELIQRAERYAQGSLYGWRRTGSTGAGVDGDTRQGAGEADDNGQATDERLRLPPGVRQARLGPSWAGADGRGELAAVAVVVVVEGRGRGRRGRFYCEKGRGLSGRVDCERRRAGGRWPRSIRAGRGRRLLIVVVIVVGDAEDAGHLTVSVHWPLLDGSVRNLAPRLGRARRPSTAELRPDVGGPAFGRIEASVSERASEIPGAKAVGQTERNVAARAVRLVSV
jgi:hypothetical protein